MRHRRLRAGLQGFLVIMGAVAFIAGLATVLFGAQSISGIERPSPAVDSEMRFYAVWYMAAGAALLRAVRRLESRSTLIRGIAVAFFVAGSARLLSWLTVGKPPPVALALMVVELLLPFIVIPWHVAVIRRSPRSTRFH